MRPNLHLNRLWPTRDTALRVKNIMTPNAVSCTPDTRLREVAHLMVEYDCGEIPVLNAGMKPIGVITDRDIVCRSIAQGRNPLDLTASDCMSSPCVTVTPDTSVADCCRILEEHQLRRLPVVNDDGRLCGIVAQADIAQHASPRKTAEVVREVSRGH